MPPVLVARGPTTVAIQYVQSKSGVRRISAADERGSGSLCKEQDSSRSWTAALVHVHSLEEILVSGLV